MVKLKVYFNNGRGSTQPPLTFYKFSNLEFVFHRISKRTYLDV